MSSPTLAVNISIAGIIQSVADIGSLAKAINWPPTQPLHSFTPGTGSFQLDTWWDDIRQLATNTNETLDLVGSLTDAFGVSVAPAHIKLLAMYADPGNTTTLVVGAAAAPFLAGMAGTTPTFDLPPGGLRLFTAPTLGWVSTGGASDGLKVVNPAGATATYSILVGGTST